MKISVDSSMHLQLLNSVWYRPASLPQQRRVAGITAPHRGCHRNLSARIAASAQPRLKSEPLQPERLASLQQQRIACPCW
jgi:hypothetical protein